MEHTKRNEGALVRRILWSWLGGGILAVAFHFGLPLAFPSPTPPGAFVLEATGWSSVADFLIVLLFLEVPVPLLEIAFENLDARRSIRWLAYIGLIPALIAAPVLLRTTHYHALVIDAQGVTILGNVSTGAQKFRFNQLDRVVHKQQQLFDTLDFRWYNQVQSSVWVYHFDARANRELAAAKAALGRSGVTVTVEEPE